MEGIPLNTQYFMSTMDDQSIYLLRLLAAAAAVNRIFIFLSFSMSEAQETGSEWHSSGDRLHDKDYIYITNR